MIRRPLAIGCMRLSTEPDRDEGRAMALIHRHQLDPSQCIYIGDGAQDPGFARKLGLVFRTTGVEAP